MAVITDMGAVVSAARITRSYDLLNETCQLVTAVHMAAGQRATRSKCPFHMLPKWPARGIAPVHGTREQHMGLVPVIPRMRG